jgi:hypothetical protein|tara:strand:+ start:31 stop:654 length:624 start_codon:yes stop_codon:yes gene_type:complete
MAVTKTHRGITYTTSSAAGIDVLLDMPLQGGVDQDKTEWLNGNAGGSYPGSLTGFNASNTDGSTVHNPRLLVVHLSTMVDNETLTLSGQCSEIMHASCQWAEAAAAAGLSQHAASGVLAAAGLATSAATLAVDTVDALTQFSVGDFVLNVEGAIVGTLTALTATQITLSANATVALSDNDALHKRTPLVLKNTTGATESLTVMMLVR